MTKVVATAADAPQKKDDPPKDFSPGELVVKSTLPVDLDFTRASQMLDLADYSNHNLIDKVGTPHPRNTDRKDILKAISNEYGDHAKVIKAPNIIATLFFNPEANNGDGEIIVGFSGSSPLNPVHYGRNLNYWYMVDSAFGDDAKVHRGFNGALKNKTYKTGNTIWDDVHAELKRLKTEHPDSKLCFTGHSAGGAVGMIAASRWIAEDSNNKVDEIWTFGQPRVGSLAFRERLQEEIGTDNIIRFEMDGDPIPALPPFDPDRYRHCGRWIPITKNGEALTRTNFDTQILQDTVGYHDELDAPKPTDMPKRLQDFRMTTRRWYQFVLGGYENHYMSTYRDSIETMRIRQNYLSGDGITQKPKPVPSDAIEGKNITPLIPKLEELSSMVAEIDAHQELRDVNASLLANLEEALTDLIQELENRPTKSSLLSVRMLSEKFKSALPPDTKDAIHTTILDLAEDAAKTAKNIERSLRVGSQQR